ncbi:MAG: sugar phosphate nucleotidyltransferase [Candidatus Aenigmarchaeota archaeon]|nr:sugar phosphate nucleotidyltransferase [Candidatus Aenigmarchaeota archaeon]
MIKRVTITVKQDLLRKLDRMIDRQHVKNRSHAVEQLIIRGLSKTDLDTAIIMAGGDGARLRPITYEIPKPLIPVKGRPVLEHQLNMLKNYDIRNVTLAVGENYEKIKEYFGNGNKFGINIEYLVEQRSMGNVGALSLIKNKIKNTFIVLNVDALINPDISEMYTFHKKEGRLATVLLAQVDDPSDYGVAKMRGSQIIDFEDRPSRTESNLVDASFYIFEPEVLKFMKKGKMMMKDLLKILVQENQLSGFLYDGFLFDVATHEGYERAIKNWKPAFA